MAFSYVPLLLVAALTTAACSSGGDAGTPSGKTDAEYTQDVTSGMKQNVAVQLTTLHDAVVELQAAAPTTTGRGWDPAQDAVGIAAMKAAWRKARVAYELVEGAVASLYPDIDAFIDARYDSFLANLASVGGDAYLFDDKGVVGMHAVERILYSDTTPSFVLDFEKVLPGYVAAAVPATEQESADFKTKLCARLVKDTQTLLDEWQSGSIDLAVAYRGLVALMREQNEKVTKAATGEEESRYSQLTLSDIHANLQGLRTAYGVFEPWVVSKAGGADDDKTILAGFAALQTAYDANTGDAIPQPPPTWSAESPSATDLQSPFGKLYSAVRAASDVNQNGSVVFEMNAVAGVLGFPGIVGSP